MITELIVGEEFALSSEQGILINRSVPRLKGRQRATRTVQTGLAFFLTARFAALAFWH